MTSILFRSRLYAVVVLLTVALAPAAVAQELLPAVTFRTVPAMAGENWPADFNGDGITDLVGRNATSGVLQVVLGNGDGTFRSPIASSTVGWAIMVGDLNHDGAIDALAQVGTDVVVLPGNRTGALGAPRTVLGATATFALITDMNGDGLRDVVLGEEGEFLHIVAGNGDLTFQPAVTLTTAAFPHGGTAMDFNGDGRRDVAVAHRYERRLIVFRNDGGLLFTPIELPIDRSSTDVTARDLDADGRLDLIVSARGPSDDGPWENGFVYVYRGNGDATFAAPSVFPTAFGAHSVVVGDFTRDGRLDVATSNRSFSISDSLCGRGITGVDTLSILPGSGGTAFGTPTTFALSPQTYDPDNRQLRDAVGSLNTSDVNRDGFPDLIVGWGRILLSAAPRTNRSPSVSAGPDQTIPGDTLTPLPGGGSDPDGHFLTFAWSDGGAGGGFNTDFPEQAADNCYFARDYGTYTVTLTADDRHGGTASDSAVLTFVRPNDPPTVVVHNPAADEVLTVGVAYTIRWEASDFDGIREIDVLFAVNGDGRYQPIAECTNLPGTATQCTWNSPGPATERGQIQIMATDNTGLEGANSSGRFRIRPPGGGGGLPPGWTLEDVGAVAVAGSANHDNGVFTVRGSGADIWGTADEFHYAYTTFSGDFDFTARVVTVQNVNQWTKAGLMIRNDTSAGSVHASVFATPTTVKGVAFQRRPIEQGPSVSTAGPAFAPPVWLRLSRRGPNIVAAYRKSITDAWTRIDIDDTIRLSGGVLVGFAVSSHVDGRLATATFDNVTIDSWPPLVNRDIGAVGVPGRATWSSIQATVEGSGADIWGTADAFRFLFANRHGNVTITSRVRSLENTHASAKAGVMIRESLAAGAKHVMVVVTPGRGIAMQYRSATGGISSQVASIAGTAPEWVRLTRTGNTFVGASSNDGLTWTTLGSITVSMSLATHVGMPVTSHNNTTLATAVFDDISFRP